MRDRRLFLATLPAIMALATSLACGIGPDLHAQSVRAPRVDTTETPGLALGGYDAVAYFSDSRPVRGKPELATRFRDAEWRFSSEANRAAFLANPTRFAPQYGGHCAWAAAGGYVAKGDPEAWKIVSGKLYLNYNKEVQAEWEKDIPGLVTKADAHWPKIGTPD